MTYHKMKKYAQTKIEMHSLTSHLTVSPLSLLIPSSVTDLKYHMELLA